MNQSAAIGFFGHQLASYSPVLSEDILTTFTDADDTFGNFFFVKREGTVYLMDQEISFYGGCITLPRGTVRLGHEVFVKDSQFSICGPFQVFVNGIWFTVEHYLHDFRIHKGQPEGDFKFVPTPHFRVRYSAKIDENFNFVSYKAGFRSPFIECQAAQYHFVSPVGVAAVFFGPFAHIQRPGCMRNYEDIREALILEGEFKSNEETLRITYAGGPICEETLITFPKRLEVQVLCNNSVVAIKNQFAVPEVYEVKSLPYKHGYTESLFTFEHDFDHNRKVLKKDGKICLPSYAVPNWYPIVSSNGVFYCPREFLVDDFFFHYAHVYAEGFSGTYFTFLVWPSPLSGVSGKFPKPIICEAYRTNSTDTWNRWLYLFRNIGFEQNILPFSFEGFGIIEPFHQVHEDWGSCVFKPGGKEILIEDVLKKNKFVSRRL